VYPKFSTVIKDGQRDFNLDIEIAASGWSKDRDAELQQYIETVKQEENNEVSSNSENEVAEHDGSETELDGDDVPELVNQSLDLSIQGTAEEGVSETESESTSSDGDADGEEKTRRLAKKASKKSRRPKHEDRDVEAIVSSNIGRDRKRQERKYHSRKSAVSQTLGRTKGSKTKSDEKRNMRDNQQF